MPRKKAVEEIYQKKSPREHVLLRPDTYVGSVERDREKVFIMNEEKNCMEEKEIEYVPALYKIFDEILVNAADNRQRDQSMKEIRIKIDIDNGYISIKNDGKGIPIEIHKEHKMYIPELIFGNLLTSSNYNDADLKTVGGRNGFGAKLANIFSKKFIVETVDTENGKKYKQKWTDNMSQKFEPDIDDVNKRAKDYTKVTFYPDFERFGMQSFHNEDILKLFVKRIYDIAGTTPSDLKVYYNNNVLKVKTFIEYAKLFIGPKAKSKSDYFHAKVNDEWEIILSLSKDNEYRQMTHVNNIWTIKGGTHVKYIENQFVKYFKENFKDKQKKIKEMLKPKMIRDHLFIFINALVVNPAFSSQTKEILTTKSSSFGSKCSIPVDILKRLMNKIKIAVKELLNFKLDQQAKKTDGSRRKKMNFPPEVEDANDAGKRYSSDCTLIVTEGLSAKTLAVAGVSELPGSNNRFGIFPLKGKLLNVREAPRGQINKNTEITNLKQILGLKHGVKYETKRTISSLRYGKVMIMTDQDYDGSHIKGLMINLFHSEWPELIHKKLFGKLGNESFVEQFITPIVVASKGRQKVAFYTVPEYEEWKKDNNNGKGWKVKYYKGLGSWQRKDGKEHFKNLRKHRIAFEYTNKNDISMETGAECGNENDNAIMKAFSKDKADARKDWISNYEEGTHVKYQRKVSYKNFIDKELILFSVNDLQRSVPSIYDGLKPGQRKILYCCFLKNNLKKEIRVAQLGGYVSEKSAYHHGEASLYQTIIGMAQDYVGSNNINLLQPNGMFGSRIKGGKDAASPRYIHTLLSPITRKLFHENDDMILNYQDDDGYPVEPINYIPIIPMVLVNGCKGIGTGWSTSIPNYNPTDIIKNIRKKLSGEEFCVMHPYYRGFKGDIVCCEEKKEDSFTYKTHGTVEIINTFNDNNGGRYCTVQVSELPICSWTENYKKYLLDLEDAEQIENVNNMSSDIDVSFTFDVLHKVKPAKNGRRRNNNSGEPSGSNSRSESPTTRSSNDRKKTKKKIYFSGELDEVFLKDMKLVSSMSCTNMVLFDINGKIRKYVNAEEILQEFYEGRLSAYSLRKKAMLKSMEHELKRISNQARFILLIVDEKLVISRRKKFEVVKDLRRHGFETWEVLKDDANTLRNRARETDAFEGEGEEEKMNVDGGDGNHNGMDVDGEDEKAELQRLSRGYKYLLSMSLSSLTKEKVERLLQAQEDMEAKVDALRKKSVKDLWRYDLDELEQQLKRYDETFIANIEEMRKDAEKKRGKNKNKNTKGKIKTKPKTKRKTTKAKAKVKTVKKTKKESSTSSVNKGMKKLTTKTKTKTTTTKSKKNKKKLLNNNTNSLPSDPFSIARSAAKKKKENAKKKSKFVDSDSDSDSDASPTAHLSLFDRVKIKRNTPQKTQKAGNSRKRKRNMIESDGEDYDCKDDDDDISDMDSIQIMEPPPKKRSRNTTTSKSKSMSKSPSKALSSSSSGTLKSITNKNKIMDLDDFDDFEYEKRNSNNKNKNISYDDEEEDDDLDISDSDDDENYSMNRNKRVLRKKVNRKSYKEKTNSLSYGDNSDSEYNLDSDDESDDDSEYAP